MSPTFLRVEATRYDQPLVPRPLEGLSPPRFLPGFSHGRCRPIPEPSTLGPGREGSPSWHRGRRLLLKVPTWHAVLTLGSLRARRGAGRKHVSGDGGGLRGACSLLCTSGGTDFLREWGWQWTDTQQPSLVSVSKLPVDTGQVLGLSESQLPYERDAVRPDHTFTSGLWRMICYF